MYTLHYFVPGNSIALGVIIALLALFLAWLALLTFNWTRLVRSTRLLKEHENAGLLLNSLAANLRRVDAGAVQENNSSDAATIFHQWLLDVRLEPDNAITRHLRAIFEAGWYESRLDVRSLIENTSGELLRGNAAIRALLSLFIILGVFGTLFGLTDTLIALEDVLQGSVRLTEDTLGGKLQQMLGTLKSAFAPSLWGVGLTVLGVLIFTVYLRAIVLPLTGLLEHTTLTVWVPHLIPTTQQRLLQNIVTTHQAAEKVAHLAESIQDKSSTLNGALLHASGSLERMTQTSENLHQFSQSFVNAVNTQVAFGKELPQLYRQLASDSQTFRADLQKNIDSSREFQRQIQQQLDAQHQQLSSVLKTLHLYEAAYVNSRVSIDKKLDMVLDKAAAAFDSLGRSNQELVAELDQVIGKPLRDELGGKLSGMSSGLDKSLGSIRESLVSQLNNLGQRIGALDPPLRKVAHDFADTFVNFDERTRGWLEKLQRQFASQNESSREQVQRLTLLSELTPELLRALLESSTKFSETSGNLSLCDSQLSKDVAALSQSIASLNHSVQVLSERVARPTSTSRPTGQYDYSPAEARERAMAMPKRRRPAIAPSAPGVQHPGSELAIRKQDQSADGDSVTRRPWRVRILDWFIRRG